MAIFATFACGLQVPSFSAAAVMALKNGLEADGAWAHVGVGLLDTFGKGSAPFLLDNGGI